MQTEEKLYTKDVARLLGVSEQTVRNYARQGLLKERRNHHGWRVFWRSEVEQLREKVMGMERKN